MAYLNMLSEPLSNQSVKFAVQVCSPDLLFNLLENLSQPLHSKDTHLLPENAQVLPASALRFHMIKLIVYDCASWLDQVAVSPCFTVIHSSDILPRRAPHCRTRPSKN